MAYRLTVIGTGYLGATHAACMAELGFEVLGLDVDAEKIARLQRRRGAVLRARAGGAAARKASTPAGCASPPPTRRPAEFGDVHFVCVGTPQKHGRVRRRPVLRRRRGRRRWPRTCTARALVVGKSTVPVGTAAAAGRPAAPSWRPAGAGVELAWNPEFLREGFAVEDTLHPDRLVFGVAVRAGREDAARGLRRRCIDDGHPGRRHRLRDRRAGQGRRQRLPGHQDLVHQRDGRGLRGRRTPT